MNWNQKKVLVAGTGISGIGAANLLADYGAEVVMYDGNEKLDLQAVQKKVKHTHLSFLLGELDAEKVQGFDLMIISPGISIDAPFTIPVKAAGIPIWSEIELAYQIGRGHVIGITGTNGKTTTTALVGQIMRDYYASTFVVGNIGTPYTEIVKDTKEDSVIVAEISSFQLEAVEAFQPEVSAILNVTPDHLDRHKTMENYAATKQKITAKQTKENRCVLNYDDPRTRAMADHMEARPVFFSRLEELSEGIFLRGTTIVMRWEQEEHMLLTTEELKIIGAHNMENAMAAIAISICYGVPAESVVKSVKAFEAVEHRIEFVRTVNGVDYYNDSKGTNPDAAIKGIEAMTKPTCLIGGGYDKGGSFDEWIQSFAGKVKLLVLLGATAEKIQKTAENYGFDSIVIAASLEEAVHICAKHAKPGEAVLLSPACASWGMFRSYEERGDLFKEYVRQL